MIIDKSDFDTIYSKNENDFFFIPRTENTCYEPEESYFWSTDSDEAKDRYIEINSNDNHLTNPNTSFSRYNYDEENSKSEAFKNSFFTIFNNQISLDEDEEEIDPYQFQFNKKHKKKYLKLYILQKIRKYLLKVKSCTILWISLNLVISERNKDLKLNNQDLQTKII
jgi:hypothetical protein